jgi:xanthine dehydrogenase YagR molybdenum-binding subunit
MSATPWGATRVVGTKTPRIDAYERVSGSAVYTRDVLLPGMLHAVIVRCPHAHARVKAVDTSRAERMPGVHTVLTGTLPDGTVAWRLGEPSSPFKQSSFLFDPHCRYAGDEVAAVAAETLQEAEEAARAVRVEYEELGFVIDPRQALGPDAAALHPGGNRVAEPQVRERGKVEDGFAAADVVLEESYSTPCVIHTPLETHGCVAQWDGPRVTVWESTQGVWEVQEDLAAVLGLPRSSVRVICRYMGGGFGSKYRLDKHTLIAVLLARRTARPVKLCLSREESFLCVGNRPAAHMKLKAGVTRQGVLTALELVSLGVPGAYPDDTDVGYLVWDLYRCPHVRIEETSVMINAGKSRAMRAPGFPQCAWALEQMVDALAGRIGMDPIELRLVNMKSFLYRGNEPPRLTTATLDRCLREGARAFGWSEARRRPRQEGHLLRGVGVAAGMWPNPGSPPGSAIVKLHADGSVNLNIGTAEIGTGTKTVMAMIVSEELGVPLDAVQVECADTATTQYSKVTGGSQTVITTGPAVREAALEVKRQLLELAAEELKVPAGELDLRDGRVVHSAGEERHLAKLQGLGQRQVLIGVGQRRPNPPGAQGLPFVAHFAEVEVNTRTGEVRVPRFLAAHDSGRVMNLLTYENQVFGGVTMGLGFGLTERRVLDRHTGRVLSASWHDYKLPTALDVPGEMECLPVDPHDTECNNLGAKGLGEPATIPTAAAIANAVCHATGIRFTEGPITPMDVLRRLAERG